MEKNFIDKFRKRFFMELDAKTGWGRNQVKELFMEVLYELLLEEEDKKKWEKKD